MWGIVIVGLINVFVIFIVIGFVDCWGCKLMLMLGFLVMAVGMGVFGIMMYIGIYFLLVQYFVIVMLLMFIVGFVMSVGLLIWVLCFEIQLLKGCDFGIICFIVINWIVNMIVGVMFLIMFNMLGNVNIFWVYAVLNVLFILLILWLVLEIKYVLLEYIECNLMKGCKLCEIGVYD